MTTLPIAILPFKVLLYFLLLLAFGLLALERGVLDVVVPLGGGEHPGVAGAARLDAAADELAPLRAAAG